MKPCIDHSNVSLVVVVVVNVDQHNHVIPDVCRTRRDRPCYREQSTIASAPRCMINMLCVKCRSVHQQQYRGSPEFCSAIRSLPKAPKSVFEEFVCVSDTKACLDRFILSLSSVITKRYNFANTEMNVGLTFDDLARNSC